MTFAAYCDTCGQFDAAMPVYEWQAQCRYCMTRLPKPAGQTLLVLKKLAEKRRTERDCQKEERRAADV